MRPASQIGLVLLGVALLAPAGCRKAKAPEPPAPPYRAPLPALPSAPTGPQPSVAGPQPSAPATTFTLQVEPPSLKVAPGAAARVKVTAARNGYGGPIAVELTNLPPLVTAPRATLAAGADSLEIEVKAAADAAPGQKTDVQAVGTAASPSAAVVSSAPFTIDVSAPFSLKAQRAAFKLERGGTVKVKITAVRSGYQGPITVELRNLPAGVDAHKAVIPEGKDVVQLELTATPQATLGARKDVTALGTTTAPAGPQVVSPDFTLNVRKAAAQAFTLSVDQDYVEVKQGGKVKVTVVADRSKGYQGPITVELHNLPGHVKAVKSVIPQGKDRVSLDVTADAKAPPGDKPDVSAAGRGTTGDNRQVSSPPFVVSVLQAGTATAARPPRPAGQHKAPRPGSNPKPKRPATPKPH